MQSYQGVSIVPGSDWRVQVATVVVDGLIVIGVLLLLALHALDTTIGVALLGPLIGARAAVHKQNARALDSGTPALASGSAGGAVALAIAVGSIVGLGWLRSKGHAIVLLLLVGGLLSAGVARAHALGHGRLLLADPGHAAALR